MGILAKNKELFLSTSGDDVRVWERDYGRLTNTSPNIIILLFLGLVTFRIRSEWFGCHFEHCTMFAQHNGKKNNLNLLKTLATESACAVVLLYVTLTHWNVKTGLTNQGSISNKSLHELQKTPGIKTRKGSLGFYIKWACGSCVVFVVCVCACVWWVLFISLLQSKFWNALLHIAF